MHDFNIDKSDYSYILIIMLFSIITCLKMIEYHMSGGIFNHDKSVYLINALVFAGLDNNNIAILSDLYYSPLISFLTSILFRLGFVSKLSIFVVTGFFGLFGNLGLYILLKNRFSKLLSLTGAIIFGSLSIILLNLASGLLDFPGVVVSIWLLIFTIVAVNKNSKYFLLIFPLFVIGFFTRYTVGFMLPILICYYLLSKNVLHLIDDLISDTVLFKLKCRNYLKSEEFKYIAFSILIGLLLIFLFIKLVVDNGGSLLFIGQSVGTFHGVKYNPNTFDASDDKLFYIKNFVVVLFREGRPLDSTLSYILCLIMCGGILCKFFIVVKNMRNRDDVFKLNFKTKYFTNFLEIVFIISFICLFIGFFIFSNHMISNICLLIMLLILFSMIQNSSCSKNNLLFSFLLVSWFFINFIFSSIYLIKVPRYAMPFIPPFICFVIYGLNYILEFVSNYFGKLKNFNNNKHNLNYSKYLNSIPILLILIFLVSTFTYILPLTIGEFGNDLVDVTNYLKDNDSDYLSKIIMCERNNYRTVKWYLNTNVTDVDPDNVDSVDSMNADYVILQVDKSFKNYDEIFHSGRFYLYSHR